MLLSGNNQKEREWKKPNWAEEMIWETVWKKPPSHHPLFLHCPSIHVHHNPNLQIYPSHPLYLFPLLTISLHSMSVSLFLFCTWVHLYQGFCCWWLFLMWAEFSDCRRANVWILLEKIPEERAGPARKVNFYYCVVSEGLAARVTLTTCLCCSVT